MRSSQVTFAFHTACFLTVHATLISILINASKKCGGNCWLAKANIQTSRPWRHGEFASAVSWDLLWDLILQVCRYLRQQPSCLAPAGNAPGPMVNAPVWLIPHVHTYTQYPCTSPPHIPRSSQRQSVEQLWGWRWRSTLCPSLISRLLFSNSVGTAK